VYVLAMLPYRNAASAFMSACVYVGRVRYRSVAYEKLES
jgi:hypothetical protein